MLSSTYDATAAIGLIKVQGLLTVEEAERCLAAIRDLAGRSRDQSGVGRVLLDASDSGVQLGTIATPYDVRDLLSGERDRLAIITSGALQTLQTRRVLSDARVETFAAEDDALQWLRRP